MERVLITGSAGFIGFHVSKRMLEEGYTVCGIDGLTTYYDVKLKNDRTKILSRYSEFCFEKCLLEDFGRLIEIFKAFKPNVVIHLAAQAGVRYSIDHPRSYTDSNLTGTFNVLEAVKELKCEHLLIASTSSVYGSNKNFPFKETVKTDTQMSFYAATKKANELMSHSYAHLYGTPITCFRFFTVYGPWGRPDMALFKFTKAMLAEKTIDIYNNGDMVRDFTYIDDLVEGIYRLSQLPPRLAGLEKKNRYDTISDIAPWRVVNIGSAKPEKLKNFIETLEKTLGISAKKNYLPIQPGDVSKTFADISLLRELTQFVPKTSIEKGINDFVVWYKGYYEKH